jgi:prepilin-type N-terminal cleavage/methylation domain-containing protein
MEKFFMRPNEKGFTLIEVMIALAIFAVFITAFVSSQATNLTISARFKEELTLHQLAADKLNEIIVSPPEWSERLELTPETGKFENNELYTFSVTYKRFIIPDLSKIQGTEENQGDNQMAQLEQRLFASIKDNMERLLWQVEVMVANSESKEEYRLSTWLYNSKGQVRYEGF